MNWNTRVFIPFFGVPLIIRLIPEIFSFPYPLGFDTVTYYIPAMCNKLVFRLDIFSLFKRTFLYYFIETLLYIVFPNPIFIIKLLGVLLFTLMVGLLGVYSFFRLRLGFFWSVLVVVFASTTLISLRLSWDLYRNMLGNIFAVLTIFLFSSDVPGVRRLGMITGLLTVVSHEASTVYLLFTLGMTILVEFMKFGYLTSRWRAYGFFLSGLLFVFQRLRFNDTYLSIPYKYLGVLKPLGIFYEGIVFMVFVSIPLIFPIFLSFNYFLKDYYLFFWTFLSIILFLIVLLGVVTIPLYRIILMLFFPLPIYAVIGLRNLVGRFRLFGSGVLVLLLFIQISIAVPYLVSSPNSPSWYSRIFYYSVDKDIFYDIPTAFLQNTVPIDDMRDLVNVVNYGLTSLPHGSKFVLVPEFSWLIYSGLVNEDSEGVIPIISNIIRVKYSSTVVSFDVIDKPFYFVWWSSDSGWYRVHRLPCNCSIIYSSGSFSLYMVK